MFKLYSGIITILMTNLIILSCSKDVNNDGGNDNNSNPPNSDVNLIDYTKYIPGHEIISLDLSLSGELWMGGRNELLTKDRFDKFTIYKNSTPESTLSTDIECIGATGLPLSIGVNGQSMFNHKFDLIIKDPTAGISSLTERTTGTVLYMQDYRCDEFSKRGLYQITNQNPATIKKLSNIHTLDSWIHGSHITSIGNNADNVYFTNGISIYKMDFLNNITKLNIEKPLKALNINPVFFSEQIIGAIALSEDGTLWVGTRFGVFWYRNENEFKVYDNAVIGFGKNDQTNQVSWIRIYKIMFDTNPENVFMSYGGGNSGGDTEVGLIRFNKNTVSFTKKVKLGDANNSIIRDVILDQKTGYFWLSINSKLYRLYWLR